MQSGRQTFLPWPAAATTAARRVLWRMRASAVHYKINGEAGVSHPHGHQRLIGILIPYREIKYLAGIERVPIDERNRGAVGISCLYICA